MAIKKITIAIDDNLVKTIDDKAKEARRSRSNYLECALEDFLKFEQKEKQLQDRISELEKELVILKATPIQNNQQQYNESIKEDRKPTTFASPLLDVMDDFND